MLNHVTIPIEPQFKLSSSLCPTNDFERDKMSNVSSINVVGSLMLTMICTIPNLSHDISIVSRFMLDLGYKHWSVVRWILRYIKGNLNVGHIYRQILKESSDFVFTWMLIILET